MVKQSWMGKTETSFLTGLREFESCNKIWKHSNDFSYDLTGLVKDNHPVALPRAACNLFLSLIAQMKASEQQKSPQKRKKSTVSTEQKHKERDTERERERESPVVCSVPWSITFIWADQAAVYWTTSWLKPPSPSNKPKSSSRISASLCVPSCCCGNVLLLLLPLYWSGCNCSKTLFGGASSFHVVLGAYWGFSNISNHKPQSFPEILKPQTGSLYDTTS